jgi:hypothetical protein
MKKTIALTVISVIAGTLLAFAWVVASSLFAAFILGFVLDPFLALIDTPFITERFGGMGFGQLFILVFTIRALISIFMLEKPNTKTGGNQ